MFPLSHLSPEAAQHERDQWRHLCVIGWLHNGRYIAKTGLGELLFKAG